VTPTADRAAEAEQYWRAMTMAAFGERGGEVIHSVSYERTVKETRAIIGDAAACREHVRYLRDYLGLTHVACLHHFGGTPQALVLASMRRFAQEVAPEFE